MSDAEADATVHATCLCLREVGILIRGGSGSGKSTLARELVADGRGLAWFARLVADDRVRLSRRGGQILARPHEAVAGLVEVWGVGVVQTAYAPACVVRLVIDLTSSPARLPEVSTARILDVELPLLTTGRSHARSLALWRVRDQDDTGVTDR